MLLNIILKYKRNSAHGVKYAPFKREKSLIVVYTLPKTIEQDKLRQTKTEK